MQTEGSRFGAKLACASVVDYETWNHKLNNGSSTSLQKKKNESQGLTYDILVDNQPQRYIKAARAARVALTEVCVYKFYGCLDLSCIDIFWGNAAIHLILVAGKVE